MNFYLRVDVDEQYQKESKGGVFIINEIQFCYFLQKRTSCWYSAEEERMCVFDDN